LPGKLFRLAALFLGLLPLLLLPLGFHLLHLLLLLLAGKVGLPLLLGNDDLLLCFGLPLLLGLPGLFSSDLLGDALLLSPGRCLLSCHLGSGLALSFLVGVVLVSS
jgi:hypothetical protein